MTVMTDNWNTCRHVIIFRTSTQAVISHSKMNDRKLLIQRSLLTPPGYLDLWPFMFKMNEDIGSRQLVTIDQVWSKYLQLFCLWSANKSTDRLIQSSLSVFRSNLLTTRWGIIIRPPSFKWHNLVNIQFLFI